jgi:hypothetical protein
MHKAIELKILISIQMSISKLLLYPFKFVTAITKVSVRLFFFFFLLLGFILNFSQNYLFYSKWIDCLIVKMYLLYCRSHKKTLSLI